MWVNTEVFIEAGRALRDEYPEEIEEARARRRVARVDIPRQPHLTTRLLRRLGTLLIASGQRQQGYGQPRGYTTLKI